MQRFFHFARMQWFPIHWFSCAGLDEYPGEVVINFPNLSFVIEPNRYAVFRPGARMKNPDPHVTPPSRLSEPPAAHAAPCSESQVQRPDPSDRSLHW